MNVRGAEAHTSDRPRLFGTFFMAGDEKTTRDMRAGRRGPFFMAVRGPLVYYHG